MGYYRLNVDNEITYSKPFLLHDGVKEFEYLIKNNLLDKYVNFYPKKLFHINQLKSTTFFNQFNGDKNKKDFNFTCININIDYVKKYLMQELEEQITIEFNNLNYIFNFNSNSFKNRYTYIEDKDISNTNAIREKIYRTILYCKNINKDFKCNFEALKDIFNSNFIFNEINNKININFNIYKWRNWKNLKSLIETINNQFDKHNINGNSYNYDFNLINDTINEFQNIIKNLMRYIKLLNSKLIENCNYCYIIYGLQNIFNFVISFNHKDNVKLTNSIYNKNILFSQEETDNIISFSKRLSSQISRITELCSIINLNKLLNLKNVFNNQNNFEHKITTYCDFTINKLSFEKLKIYLNNNLVKKIKFVYNFYCSYSLRYKNMNLDYQLSDVFELINDNEDKIIRMSVPYIKDNITNCNIRNFHKNDNNLLLINSNITIYAFINPVNLLLNNYTEFSYEQFYNHQSRYNASAEFDTILSTNLYLQMVLLININFREKIKSIKNNKTSLSRLYNIHKLIKYYNNSILSYSSNSIYQKDERNFLYFKIINESHLHDEEKDTELLYKNLWQEANIISGKIISLLALSISIVAFVLSNAFQLSLLYPEINNNPNNDQTIKIMSPFSLILFNILVLICILFIFYIYKDKYKDK